MALAAHRTVPPRVGSAHHAAKITEADVRRLRAARATGMTHDQIFEAHGRALGITHSNMVKIVLGYSWKHVEP